MILVALLPFAIGIAIMMSIATFSLAPPKTADETEADRRDGNILGALIGLFVAALLVRFLLM